MSSNVQHRYPYLPQGRVFQYVSRTNPFMARALEIVDQMERECPEANRATASVIVQDGKIITEARNNSMHLNTFCPRVALQSPSGQEYELCPDHCHQKNHSEASALRRAQGQTQGADLYLGGHWWACKPCWDSIIAAGIKDVYLVEDAFDRYAEVALRGRSAGIMREKKLLTILGAQKKELEAYLSKVNMVATDSLQNSSGIVLLPGADLIAEASVLPIYDYRNLQDIRVVLTKLSQAFEKE